MPDWHMKDHKITKPKNTDEYFEHMCRVILASGLNWRVVEKKWPGIRTAFKDFQVTAVMKFLEPEIEELMMNPAVIRNLPKIRAIVANAKTMYALEKEFSSFATYLDTTHQATGEEGLVKDISKRFAFLGKSTTTIFLFAIGHDMPKAMAEWQARHPDVA